MKHYCTFAIAAYFLIWPSAHALNIVANYVTPGNNLPGIGIAGETSPNMSGGGDLEEIFNVAVSAWEQLIQDDFTLTLHYGWVTTEPISVSAFHQGTSAGGSPRRETEGSIAFNNDNGDAGDFRFYLDPTPSDNAEFAPAVEVVQDLGGGLLTTQREFAPVDADAIGSIDLLSTAMHEIGHALGLVGWPFYLTEVSDGDIDVTLPQFNGTTIPVGGTHLAIVGPLMSSTNRALGHRRGISQLDLLAVCQLSQFTDCVLASPNADFNSSNTVDGVDFLLWQTGFGIRSGAQLSNGDANGDGDTDNDDLLFWQSQFGSMPPNSGTVAAVPEPTSILLLLGLTVVGMLVRLLGNR